MKQKLLFVIDSLDCAGAEKSLISLLSLLDYSKFDVDLLLFAHGGILEELLPQEVNKLKPLKYTQFTQLHLLKAIIHSFKSRNFKMLICRSKFTFKIRLRKYSNVEKAKVYWECVSEVIDNNQKEYDIAISYAQGVPTFYVANKVKAKRKFAWVNASLKLKDIDKNFQRNYYNQYKKIVTVSDSAKRVFTETYPEFKNKMEVIYDLNSPDYIFKMSDLGNFVYEEYSGIKILSIGRLAKTKGYDIALDACRKLKERGIDFKWYVLGKGPLENDIKQYIQKYNLGDHFILLGVKSNPYPYIKNADIYVQTSRFEGFGLAIAEARMLNIPVVTTRFDAVFNQMIHEKNGLIVDMDGEAVCNGIIQLIDDQNLRKEIINYLEHEKKGNIEEIEKFYQLIG